MHDLNTLNTAFLLKDNIDDTITLVLDKTHKNKDYDIEKFISMLLPYVVVEDSYCYLTDDSTDGLYKLNIEKSLLLDDPTELDWEYIKDLYPEKENII